MKTLSYDTARCCGVIAYNTGETPDGLPTHTMCNQRDTCARHQAWLRWDRAAGIPDYQQIAVSMAVPYCRHKIEVKDGQG